MPNCFNYCTITLKEGNDVTLSQMTAANVGQLQQTLQVNLLKSALASQAALAVTMLDKMNTAAEETSFTSAPHPTLGQTIDLRG